MKKLEIVYTDATIKLELHLHPRLKFLENLLFTLVIINQVLIDLWIIFWINVITFSIDSYPVKVASKFLCYISFSPITNNKTINET